MSLPFSLLTPDAVLFKGEVESVLVATESGEVEVFEGHAPIGATILFSRLSVRQKHHEDVYLVRQGFLFADPFHVEVMANAIHKEKEIDYTDIKGYLEFVTGLLDKPEALNSFQIKHLAEEKIALERNLDQQT
ncbi:F0F1 ATP synthase subunit epsilon [Candidatus Uhrbacteria bacterium]|nr:F0F1 ATP synthase subunit epsilon [Candidatus Uhrbacteria bacterium]